MTEPEKTVFSWTGIILAPHLCSTLGCNFFIFSLFRNVDLLYKSTYCNSFLHLRKKLTRCWRTPSVSHSSCRTLSTFCRGFTLYCGLKVLSICCNNCLQFLFWADLCEKKALHHLITGWKASETRQLMDFQPQNSEKIEGHWLILASCWDACF